MIVRIRSLLRAYPVVLTVCACIPCLCLEADPIVTEFTTSYESFEIDVAADNSGNAIVVLADGGIIQTSRSIAGGPWSPLEDLSTAPKAGFPCVAMSSTGSALAAWRESDNPDPGSAFTNINTAYYTGSSWETPTPSPLYTTTDLDRGLSVSMNSVGNGLVVWSAGNIFASFFSGGVWSPSVIIGLDLYSAYVTSQYSKNGDASAIWTLFDNPIRELYANTFDGTNWQTVPVLLDNNISDPADSGIDDLGNTIVIWAGGASGNDIVTSRFDGSSWSAPEILSPGPDNHEPKIAMDSDGTAVAVWCDANFTIQMKQFDGSVWGEQILVTDNGEHPQVTMDDSGNVLFGWIDTAGDSYCATMAKGSVTIENLTFLAESTGSESFHLALSDNSSLGFAVWGIAGFEFSNTSGARLFLPPMPTGLHAQVCPARLMGVLDCSNTLKWDASTDPDVDHYDIYREGVFIGSVLANDPLEYTDTAVCKQTVVYSIKAVNTAGVASDPENITVGP